jgi:hypothetical protein
MKILNLKNSVEVNNISLKSHVCLHLLETWFKLWALKIWTTLRNVTNEDCNEEAVPRRLNSGDAYYHSVFILLYKIPKIIIYKIVILPVSTLVLNLVSRPNGRALTEGG